MSGPVVRWPRMRYTLTPVQAKKRREVEMKGRNRAGISAVAIGIVTLTATLAFSQAKGPERPGWFRKERPPTRGDDWSSAQGDESSQPAAPAAVRASSGPRLPKPCRRADTRPFAAIDWAARAQHCNASNGNKPWATPTPTRLICPRAAAAPRRSPSIRRAICGSFSASRRKTAVVRVRPESQAYPHHRR